MNLHHMVTKEGLDFSFYNSEESNTLEILNSIEDFSHEDYWVIDAGENPELFKIYQTFEEDNSFVLIPKSSVIRFYTTTSNMKKINKSNIKEILGF